MKARAQAQKRNEELSAKRKKFKQGERIYQLECLYGIIIELESKENEHYKQMEDERVAQRDMEKEVGLPLRLGYKLVLTKCIYQVIKYLLVIVILEIVNL